MVGTREMVHLVPVLCQTTSYACRR